MNTVTDYFKKLIDNGMSLEDLLHNAEVAANEAKNYNEKKIAETAAKAALEAEFDADCATIASLMSKYVKEPISATDVKNGIELTNELVKEVDDVIGKTKRMDKIPMGDLFNIFFEK